MSKPTDTAKFLKKYQPLINPLLLPMNSNLKEEEKDLDIDYLEE